MKVVVVSDSHGSWTILEDLFEKHFDADFFLHLGDSQLPEYYLSHFCCVAGNCDYTDLPLQKDITIAGYKIHMEHGHSYDFMFNSEKYINSIDCDIFLFGHTHIKKAFKVGEKYVFNPGSLTRPRDGDKGSYLILYLEKDKPIKYEFKFID